MDLYYDRAEIQVNLDNLKSTESDIKKSVYSTSELYNKYKDTVDLELPSGTLWMKYNLGAEKETDFLGYTFMKEEKKYEYF